MDKLGHIADRKSMRVQDASGAAVIAGREQFQRADAVGLDVTPVASGPHGEVSTALLLLETRIGSLRFSAWNQIHRSPLEWVTEWEPRTIASACWPRRVTRRGHFLT
jgi:hypothetical protein